MNEGQFQYIGMGKGFVVYTRQQTFSVDELQRKQGSTLTEIVMFDRYIIPTTEEILSFIQRSAENAQRDLSQGNNLIAFDDLEEGLREMNSPEITVLLASNEPKTYQILRGLVPSLDTFQTYTHFIRAQVGYLVGKENLAQINSSDVSMLSNPHIVVSSLRHPQNLAMGYGISGKINIGVTEDWRYQSLSALRILIEEGVRKSRSLAISGKVHGKVVKDIYSKLISSAHFVENLRSLPDSSDKICEDLATRTVSSFLLKVRQQRENETVLGAGIASLSQMIADGGIPRDPSKDRELVN